MKKEKSQSSLKRSVEEIDDRLVKLVEDNYVPLFSFEQLFLATFKQSFFDYTNVDFYTYVDEHSKSVYIGDENNVHVKRTVDTTPTFSRPKEKSSKQLKPQEKDDLGDEGEPSKLPNASKSPKPQKNPKVRRYGTCKFGASCRNRKTTCHFHHPGDSPKRKNESQIPQQRKCRFGASCRNRNTTCRFNHPSDPAKVIPSPKEANPEDPSSQKQKRTTIIRQCRFGKSCRNRLTTCPFDHPDDSPSPKEKANPEDSSSLKTKKKGTTIIRQCRFGKSCRNRLTTCPFDHPDDSPSPKEKANPEDSSSLKTKKKGTTIIRQCRFGKSCRNRLTTCSFNHPNDAPSPKEKATPEDSSSPKKVTTIFRQCKLGTSCTYQHTTCRFLHPGDGKVPPEEDLNSHGFMQRHNSDQCEKKRGEIRKIQAEMRQIIGEMMQKLQEIENEMKRARSKSEYDRLKEERASTNGDINDMTQFLMSSTLYLMKEKDNLNLMIREVKRLKARLPILTKRREILDAVKQNDVLVFVGQTGSGKSTQICQYLLDEGYENIVCTQPRKINVFGLEKRVREEFVEENVIGKMYQRMKMRFVTDKLLLNEIIKDPLLRHVNVVIVDEAHERTIETDLLLAKLKSLSKIRGNNFKIVISSATLDVKLFTDYFSDGLKATSLDSKGRVFPVKTRFLRREIVPSSPKYLKEIVSILTRRKFESYEHVLIFFSGTQEIDYVVRRLEKIREISDLFEILPLHGRLSHDDQQKIFAEFKKSKIICATNIAETSLTIDGVVCVIDTGRVKEMKFDPGQGIQVLEESYVSLSSLEQRRGRAGRTRPGWYYPLFTRDQSEQFVPQNIPEIKRTHLSLAVLKLKLMKVKDISKFDFLEKPDQKALDDSIKELSYLGALNPLTNELTKVGNFMGRLETTPMFSRLLYEGMIRNRLMDCIVLVSLLSVGENLFYRGDDEGDKFSKLKTNEQDDVFVLLKIYEDFKKFEQTVKNMSRSDRARGIKKFCVERNIKYKSINVILKTIRDLKFSLKNEFEEEKLVEGVDQTGILSDRDLVKELITRAFFLNICIFTGFNYVNINLNENVYVHPSSVLTFQKKSDSPKYILFIKLAKTSRTFIKTVMSIEKDLAFEILKEFMEGQPSYRKKVDKCRGIRDKETPTFRTFKNIGPLLLFTKIIGKGGRNIKKLQKRFNCWFEIDKHSGTVTLYTRSKEIQKIERGFQEFLAEKREELMSENLERKVSGGIRGIFTAGGEILDLLLPSEFLSFTFKIYSKEDNVRTTFEKFGKISTFVCRPDRKCRRGYVKYFEKSSAMKAFEKIDESFHKISVDTKEKEIFHESTKVRINQREGKVQRDGYVLFETKNDAVTFIRSLRNKFFRELRISVFQENKIQEMEYGYKVKMKCNDLSWSEEIVRQSLKANGVKFKSIMIYREKTPSQSTNWIGEDDMNTGLILSKFQSLGKVRDVYIPKPGSFLVTYETVEGANNCEKEFANDPKYHAARDVSITFSIHRRIFEAIDQDFLKLKDEMEKSNVTVSYREPPESSKGVQFYSVRIDGGNVDEKHKAKIRFERMMSVIPKVDIKDRYKLFRSVTGVKFLKSVEKKHGVYFHWKKRENEILLYCYQNKRVMIEKLLLGFIEESLKNQVTHKIVFDLFSQELYVQCNELIKRVGKGITAKFRFERRKFLLKVEGNGKVVQEVVHGIERIQRKIQSNRSGKEDPNLCSICLSDVESVKNELVLSLCGCRIHKECCRMMFEFNIANMSFPIKCPKCTKVVLIQDILSLMSEKQFDDLCKSSYREFKMKMSWKYPNCPSADCLQVFCKDDIDKDLGKAKFTCDMCNGEYCGLCSENFHPDQSCKEYEASKKRISEDDMRTLGLKRCPKCQTIIHRFTGCNHMTCNICKIHFCWLCRAPFETAGETYNHQSSCPGEQLAVGL